jgi:hypothetical protein
MWRHASRHGLIDADLDPRVVRSIGRRLWFVAGCFALSIQLAYVTPLLAYVAWVATFVLVFTTDWVSWRQSRRATTVEIPLDDAQRARVRIDYGAGILGIKSGEDDDIVVDGSFGGGVDRRTTRTDDAVAVNLALPPQSSILNPRFPWAWGIVIDWEVALSGAIPIDLEVEMSGGQARMDLDGLRIGRLEFVCPGSDVELNLPSAAGDTAVEVRAKGALVVIHVPDGVGARIRQAGTVTGGIGIDTSRFPPDGDGSYRSADFATAANRVDIRAEVPGGLLTVVGPGEAPADRLLTLPAGS